MEVEVKLRLPDAAAHRRLSAYLAPRLLHTDAQRNAFFDAPARPLAAATAAFRVRLYGPVDRAPSRAVLALKRRGAHGRRHRHHPCRPGAYHTEDKLTESIFVSGDDPLSMPTRGFIIIQSSCRGSVSGPELMETRYVAASAFDFNACDGQNGLLRNSAVPVEDSVVVASSMVLTQPETGQGSGEARGGRRREYHAGRGWAGLRRGTSPAKREGGGLRGGEENGEAAAGCSSSGRRRGSTGRSQGASRSAARCCCCSDEWWLERRGRPPGREKWGGGGGAVLLLLGGEAAAG
ncbi:triphosphate tunel metalloenzyme 3-like [Hordeum vulgare]|nr:triphosphate tunel metalloenzyme 3-like [Hordeum vulgare]